MGEWKKQDKKSHVGNPVTRGRAKTRYFFAYTRKEKGGGGMSEFSFPWVLVDTKIRCCQKWARFKKPFFGCFFLPTAASYYFPLSLSLSVSWHLDNFLRTTYSAAVFRRPYIQPSFFWTVFSVLLSSNHPVTPQKSSSFIGAAHVINQVFFPLFSLNSSFSSLGGGGGDPQRRKERFADNEFGNGHEEEVEIFQSWLEGEGKKG